MKHLLLILFFALLGKLCFAQCTTLGQTPATAFPVCGTKPFVQSTVPTCVNGTIPVSACSSDNIGYQDVNPYWYKFTCYTSGTLDFKITPNNLDDDYDWQLFDVTNINPASIYVNASLAVVGNWSGNSSLESARGYSGVTGTSSTAANSFECASNPPELGGSGPYRDAPTLSRSPNIIAGHQYLLMISHFSGDNQSGYTLSFTGGTASITDPLSPKVSFVEAVCDGTQVRVKLNKPMQCKTLAPNGSDFYIPGMTVISAFGANCSQSFDMDSVVLTLSSPLPPGNHTLYVVTGIDSNTLVDNCNNEIPDSTAIPFIMYAQQPTPMDSVTPVECAPYQVQLIFRKNIQCSSVAPDGSDFFITGPYPVTVESANGYCSNGLTKGIVIKIKGRLYNAGTFTIHLQSGSDGNSIIDECGQETPVPATIDFVVAKDTVTSKFNIDLHEGCRIDTINYTTAGGNGITNYAWTFDNTKTSSSQNPVIYYSTFGDKTTQLITTNGFCSDTTIQTFYLNHDSLRAAFSGPTVNCPNDFAIFTDSSIGQIIAWNWQFGNGNTSNLQNPPAQSYHTSLTEQNFPVSLIVTSNKNCLDTTIKYLKVVRSCFIAVPSGFTPNHDGINDYLYPLNAYKATQLLFMVYNKYGQLIFQTKDWTKKWDGTFNSYPQPSGVYVWMLQYTDVKGARVFQKGTTVLIR